MWMDGGGGVVQTPVSAQAQLRAPNHLFPPRKQKKTFAKKTFLGPSLHRGQQVGGRVGTRTQRGFWAVYPGRAGLVPVEPLKVAPKGGENGWGGAQAPSSEPPQVERWARGGLPRAGWLAGGTAGTSLANDPLDLGPAGPGRSGWLGPRLRPGTGFCGLPRSSWPGYFAWYGEGKCPRFQWSHGLTASKSNGRPIFGQGPRGASTPLIPGQ